LSARVRTLVSDMTTVWLHGEAPESLEARLPPINLAWLKFGGAPGGDRVDQAASRDDRSGAFEHFLDGIKPSRRPTLDFEHLLLPHVPYAYLPTGQVYGSGEDFPGLVALDSWGDRPATERSQQRYLLQVAYLDRLLGRLIARLRSTGMWERALLVVTADHGVGLTSGRNRRFLTMANVDEIAPVPLFVKLPGQRRGRTLDAHVQTVDVLPTIADVLGIRVPWRTDGRSALEQDADRRQIVIESSANPRVTISAASLDAHRRAVWRRQAALFPPGSGLGGLYRIGPHPVLLGRSLGALGVTGATGERATLDQANALARVDPDASRIPARMTGRIVGGPARDRPIAVAVNDRIAAVAWSYARADRVTYDVLVPRSRLRAGANRVDILAVSHPKGRWRLARLASTR
jgi:Sulfatase